MPDERWRRIKGWDKYQVSDTGRVRKAVSKQELSATLDKQHGYLVVELNQDGRYRTIFVHILVCTAFNGDKPSPRHEVAHGDGTRLNNDYRNLRWATRKENCQDANKHGTKWGDIGTAAKLSREDVFAIDRMAWNEPQKVIASKYGVNQSTISRIINRARWRKLPIGETP